MITEAVLFVTGAYLIYVWLQDPITQKAHENANDTKAKFQETRLHGVIRENTDLKAQPNGMVRARDFTDHEKDMEQGKRKFPIAKTKDKSATVADIQKRSVAIEHETKSMFNRSVAPNHSITRPGEGRDVGRVASSATDLANSRFYNRDVYTAAQDF
jgi:hypothetical protein